MILFIKHISIEGPETIGDFFTSKGYQINSVELGNGGRLPENLNSLEAVISLGGPMNVYEEDQYPFLKAEDDFIKKVMDQKIPFLGICLGAQLLSKACHAKVGKSPQKEVGFYEIYLTEDGAGAPIFNGLEKEMEVFQWHEDMFDIPLTGNAALLARSQACPHQAFRVGPCAYGFQFHVEITDQSIKSWADAYFKKGDPVLERKAQSMLEDYKKKKNQMNAAAYKIYENFLKIMARHTIKV